MPQNSVLGNDVQFDVEEAHFPVLPLKKLKDYIRQRAKEKPISVQELEKVKGLLPQD